MGQNYLKPFGLFRQWLEQRKPRSAAEITSHIRALEPILVGAYASGQPVVELHSLYGKLADAEKFSMQERKRVAQQVALEIGGCFKNIDDPKRRKQNGLKNCNKKQVDKYKTALITYVQFLSDVFGMFTLGELEKQGIIKRKRKNHGNLEPGIFTGTMLRQGLYPIFKKHNLLSAGKNSMISISLDTLQKILNEYAEQYGVNLRQEIYGAFSFVTAPNFGNTIDWESIFLSNVATEADGKLVKLGDVIDAEYDGYDISIRFKDYIDRYTLAPGIYGRSSKRHEPNLSIRILSQPPMMDQIKYLERLTGYCEVITNLTKEYSKEIEAFEAGTSDSGSDYTPKTYDDYVVAINEALSKIDFNQLDKVAIGAFRTLEEYARGFRIELVAE